MNLSVLLLQSLRRPREIAIVAHLLEGRLENPNNSLGREACGAGFRCGRHAMASGAWSTTATLVSFSMALSSVPTPTAAVVVADALTSCWSMMLSWGHVATEDVVFSDVMPARDAAIHCESLPSLRAQPSSLQKNYMLLLVTKMPLGLVLCPRAAPRHYAASTPWTGVTGPT